jgi:formiminotetrahydrofolate cyclodeaminase
VVGTGGARAPSGSSGCSMLAMIQQLFLGRRLGDSQ